MRTVILVLINLFACVAACAYESMIREDRVWIYSYEVYDEAFSVVSGTDYYFSFSGSKTVNGKTYYELIQKCETEWECVDNDGKKEIVVTERHDGQNIHIAWMREDIDSQKVYLLVDGVATICPDHVNFYKPVEVDVSNQEVVLYNFNLVDVDRETSFIGIGIYFNRSSPFSFTGDYQFVPYSVVSQQSKQIQGSERKYLTLSPFGEGQTNGNCFSYIEGVGNIGRGILNRPYVGPLLISETKILGFSQLTDTQGNVLFDNRWLQQNSISEIYSDGVSSGTKYDLTGREIRNPQRGTIYIQNGEKRIAR